MQRFTHANGFLYASQGCGDYVLHSEAQAEITRLQAEVSNLKNWIDHHATEAPRLQAEVERLRKLNLTLSMERHVPAMRVADKMHKQQAQATDDYMALLEQLKTSRNDALDEAAKMVHCMAEAAYDGGLSHHGQAEVTMNAIRALKRPTS